MTHLCCTDPRARQIDVRMQAAPSLGSIRRWPGMLLSHSLVKYILDQSAVKPITTVNPVSSYYRWLYSTETKAQRKRTASQTNLYLLPLQGSLFVCLLVCLSFTFQVMGVAPGHFAISSCMLICPISP